MKTHLLALRDAIVLVGTVVAILIIICLFFRIAGGIQVRSEEFYRGQDLLRSYTVNHVLHENKHIYQGGEK